MPFATIFLVKKVVYWEIFESAFTLDVNVCNSDLLLSWDNQSLITGTEHEDKSG